MTNKPQVLTVDEIREIASLPEIQALWQPENVGEMEQILSDIYCVKFKFINACPGYCGDLFLIQPDVLDSDLPPIRLIREGKKLVRY